MFRVYINVYYNNERGAVLSFSMLSFFFCNFNYFKCLSFLNLHLNINQNCIIVYVTYESEVECEAKEKGNIVN